MACLASWRQSQDAVPTWHRMSAITCFLATMLAVCVGDYIFWTYSEKYFEYLALNTYIGARPGQDTGEMLADAGRVYFGFGAVLDRDKSMGFKHGDMYCVAPVTLGEGHSLSTYDFWAVGVNCCTDSTGPDFKFNCPDAAKARNRQTRSALRVLSDHTNRPNFPFWRLAVQQAEAAYGIKARHPIFLYWEQDPVDRMNGYYRQALKSYLMWTFIFVVFNLFITFGAAFCFGKLAKQDF